MKTIFYIKSKDETSGDYWFNSVPYNEWFALENTLYDPNGHISRKTKDDNNYVKSVTVTLCEDSFSDEGIIRRIQLYIS